MEQMARRQEELLGAFSCTVDNSDYGLCAGIWSIPPMVKSARSAIWSVG